MTTTHTEEHGTTEAATAAKEPEAPKKVRVAARRPHLAASKGKSGKKATPAKKGVKRNKATTGKAARQGSKTAKILDLLQRPGGASLKELMKATGWQPHSVRGFLSGTLGKKMGLKVTSAKAEDGERSYSVKA